MHITMAKAIQSQLRGKHGVIIMHPLSDEFYCVHYVICSLKDSILVSPMSCVELTHPVVSMLSSNNRTFYNGHFLKRFTDEIHFH